MPDGKSPVRPTALNPTAQDAAFSEHRSHAYPRDLAEAVHGRCQEILIGTGIHLTLPAPAQLEEVLSVCYQASLLREERRPVTFRVALAGPEVFPPAEGPPAGLHRLVFGDSRPFDQHELRRLAPAAVFSRTLMGATIDRGRGPRIWGLIHSGAHWLQSVRGGRETQQAIPPVLIIASVSGPGRMLVSAGTITIAELISDSVRVARNRGAGPKNESPRDEYREPALRCSSQTDGLLFTLRVNGLPAVAQATAKRARAPTQIGLAPSRTGHRLPVGLARNGSASHRDPQGVAPGAALSARIVRLCTKFWSQTAARLPCA
jgi:hypothetical protein